MKVEEKASKSAGTYVCIGLFNFMMFTKGKKKKKNLIEPQTICRIKADRIGTTINYYVKLYLFFSLSS